MKATLEFNLPEDQSRLNLAVNSKHWHQLAYDIDCFIAEGLKPRKNNVLDEARSYNDALEDVRWFLRAKIKDFDIALQYSEIEETDFL